MPTSFVGASIEQRAIPYWALFEARTLLQNEIDNRAWAYLKEIGHEWYKGTSMQVTFTKRGKVDLIKINAEYEQNHQSHQVELEIPLKQFEALTPAAISPPQAAT